VGGVNVSRGRGQGGSIRSGPTVALRLEMRLYRWCITFGEMVLNWEDL
jgi:hypothetical protein